MNIDRVVLPSTPILRGAEVCENQAAAFGLPSGAKSHFEPNGRKIAFQGGSYLLSSRVSDF